MSRLNKRDRMQLMELAAEVAGEASRNPNVVFMIEFQEMLIERVYLKMSSLLEADLHGGPDADDEDPEDDDEGRVAFPTSAAAPVDDATSAPPAKRARARRTPKA
jgi:hypothetical protein